MFGFACDETAGADAGADPPRPPRDREASRALRVGRARVPAAGREVAGHDRVRGRAAQAHPDGGALDPALPGRLLRPASRGRDREDHQAGAPGRAARRRHDLPRESDRALRGGRADGRRRADRAQDHRRHLRRDGAPRRRRLLGQGSLQGRPQRGLRGALGGQEPREGGAGAPLRGAAGLRDRRRRARLRPRRHLRDREPRRARARAPGAQALRPDAEGHHRVARSAAPDLPRHVLPRALRAGGRRASPGRAPRRRRRSRATHRVERGSLAAGCLAACAGGGGGGCRAGGCRGGGASDPRAAAGARRRRPGGRRGGAAHDPRARRGRPARRLAPRGPRVASRGRPCCASIGCGCAGGSRCAGCPGACGS